MTRRGDITLSPAVACARSGYTRAHAWEPEDSATLVAYGTPDHGVSVLLGRCRHCGTALLSIEALSGERDPGAPRYEITGAVL